MLADEMTFMFGLLCTLTFKIFTLRIGEGYSGSATQEMDAEIRVCVCVSEVTNVQELWTSLNEFHPFL